MLVAGVEQSCWEQSLRLVLLPWELGASSARGVSNKSAPHPRTSWPEPRLFFAVFAQYFLQKAACFPPLLS